MGAAPPIIDELPRLRGSQGPSPIPMGPIEPIGGRCTTVGGPAGEALGPGIIIIELAARRGTTRGGAACGAGDGASPPKWAVWNPGRPTTGGPPGDGPTGVPSPGLPSAVEGGAPPPKLTDPALTRPPMLPPPMLKDRCGGRRCTGGTASSAPPPKCVLSDGGRACTGPAADPPTKADPAACRGCTMGGCEAGTPPPKCADADGIRRSVGSAPP